MSKDLIRYDLQVQDALRGVVRKVLADAARDGLPGEHHFYITFRTHAPGVKLSNRLREQYPEEMTIILQYQFWDLKVDELGFEVGLHFKNVPERLVVPFEAIAGFYDPSVQFGLKFESQDESEDEEIEGEDDEPTINLGPIANAPRPLPRELEKKPEPKLAPALNNPTPPRRPATRLAARRPRWSPSTPSARNRDGPAKVMAEVVNLRQARKRRDRAERETEAEANRIKHGLGKAEKTLATARREQDARKLEGHRLEPGPGADD